MSDSQHELRILHVEDNPQDALLVERTLRKEGLPFLVTRLESEEEFVRAVGKGCPDLILSDFSMPRFSGAAALSRARVICPDVPFIFVSGHIGEDRAIESLRNGATDYVLKDQLSRLGPVVRRALAEVEERRKRRNAEADLVLEKAPVAVVTMSLDGRITGWNLQAERTFGWSREEVLGRPLSEVLIPPAYRIAHRMGLEQFARTGEGPVLDRRIELPALHKEGFELPVEMTVIPIPGAGRLFFAAFLSDMRGIQREAAALAVDYAVTKILAESPTLDTAIPGLLRAMTECLSCDLAQFWKVDAEAGELHAVDSWPPLEETRSEFVRANRSITLLKGVGLPGEVWRRGEGVWVSDVAAGDVDPRTSLALREGIRGAFGFPVIDGPEVLGIIECFHREVRPPDPEVLEMVTEIGRILGKFDRRKSDERELSHQHRTFEVRLEERTRQVREVADELDTFVYSVAHDLRAPLRALVGFSDILIQEGSTLAEGEFQTVLGRIRSAANGMDSMVENLLAYSRLFREEIVMALVDLNWEVEETLSRMEREFRERDADVRVESPLPHALAHHRTLRQVLMSLLSNALKFVAPGVRPRIRILAEDRGDRIRLSIVDNGIGIPREQHERIFKVFERLHSVSEYPGSGVGLAIVRRGMDRMQGRSGVESAPGKGSTFWIELKKASAPLAPPPG